MLEKYALIFSPLIGILIAEHFLLTRIYGKKSSIQRIFNRASTGSHIDTVYILSGYVANATVRQVAFYATLPGATYLAVDWLRTHFTIHGAFGWLMPENYFAAMVVWLVARDLPIYVAHVAMHKVPFLWRFHKLHHAAEEMNIVVGGRVSLAEQAINHLFTMVVLTMLLGLPRPEFALVLTIIISLIDKLQHSDLPWDYGFLGYVIASPRFHRLHHSSDPAHHDTNYGNIFSFWDFLFGTQSAGYAKDPAMADETPLGLDSPEETRRYNTWRVAILSETHLDYAVKLGRRMIAGIAAMSRSRSA